MMDEDPDNCTFIIAYRKMRVSEGDASLLHSLSLNKEWHLPS
ncbi:hypothetical protein [Lederbergia citrisecunda]|nr:hypothetical protein [Lederbergia citrisecunda]